MIAEPHYVAVNRGSATLSRRCPRCGDNMIHNHTGIECGAFGCEYQEGGEKYNYRKVRATLPKEAPEPKWTIGQADSYRKRCLAYLQYVSKPAARPEYEEERQRRITAARKSYNVADERYRKIVREYGQ